MLTRLRRFETIARAARDFTEPQRRGAPPHPFDARNIHPDLPAIVRELFDNGHYSQATFEAFKYLDKEVQRHTASAETGFKLMMQVFGDSAPAIRLTPLSNQSQVDEQKGYQFIFAGSDPAIRNPRGHEYAVADDPNTCLDHLSLASSLLRRLAQAGYR
jgi:uncharacterized protein (TIGR02391 family)